MRGAPHREPGISAGSPRLGSRGPLSVGASLLRSATTIGVLSVGAGGGAPWQRGASPGACRCWLRDDLLLQCPQWHLATFPDPNVGGEEGGRQGGGRGCIAEAPPDTLSGEAAEGSEAACPQHLWYLRAGGRASLPSRMELAGNARKQAEPLKNVPTFKKKLLRDLVTEEQRLG